MRFASFFDIPPIEIAESLKSQINALYARFTYIRAHDRDPTASPITLPATPSAARIDSDSSDNFGVLGLKNNF